MPATAVDLPKSTDYWEIPYRYDHPTGIQLMDGALPEGYNMLHKSYVDVKSSLSDFDPEENNESEKRAQREDQEEKEQEEEKEVISQKEDENEMLEEEEEGEKHQSGRFQRLLVEELRIFTSNRL